MTYGLPYDIFFIVVKPLFPAVNALAAILFSLVGLDRGPQAALGALSVLVAAIISLFYVILIDQEEYQRIKDRQQELQNKYKEAQEEGDSEKAEKFMKENMAVQKEFMMVSFKPIIGSMVVFFLVMPWVLHTFVPVVQLQPQGDVYRGELTMLGGRYTLTELTANRTGNSTYVLAHDGKKLGEGDTLTTDGLEWHIRSIKKVANSEERVRAKLSLEFLDLPFSLPLIGSSLGWLGYYIIFQIPFTFLFRKMLGVQ
ncbi:MAG: EMC3/TMCO1 family protein [Candidatus Nanohaloarchaea archaeon]|nr:EMC3/TMCO1 family protein [Candidatus Nanohaloarchaea archaeon]